MKTVLIFVCIFLVLLAVCLLFFKLWRSSSKKYKEEHERCERLRYQLELKENEEKIRKEVFGDVEKKDEEVSGLSGRDKYNAINERMRNNKD